MTTANIFEQIDLYNKADTAERKILVVEDDPEWQILIGKAISKYDETAQVKYAYSAHDAQDLLNQSTEYDLIIADYYLEGDSTGMELWRECQKSYRDTPFMMMSGMTEVEFLDLIKWENNYPLYLSKAQKFQSAQLQDMLTWYLGESVVPAPHLDQRMVSLILLFATLPFLGVSFLAPWSEQITAPIYKEQAPSEQMEEKLRRVRTATIEKAFKPIQKVSSRISPVDVSTIVTQETKEQMDSILSRADLIISEARQK